MDGVTAGFTGSPGEAADADCAAGVSALFRAHHLELVRLALVMVGDLAAAEDVVQDAFERLHRRWHRLRNRDSALAYARSAVLNGCRVGARRAVKEIRVVSLATGRARAWATSGTWGDVIDQAEGTVLLPAVRIRQRRARAAALPGLRAVGPQRPHPAPGHQQPLGRRLVNAAGVA